MITVKSSLTLRVSVPGEVLTQELRGESVLLHLGSGRYFGLDEVGTRMWNALTTSGSVQTAHEVLFGEYDVDTDVLRRDLFDLIENLARHGLVKVCDQ